MGRALSPFEDNLRRLVRQTAARGKVDIFVNYLDKREHAASIRVDKQLAASYRAALDDAYWSLVSEQRPYEIEYRLLTGEGRVRWIRERGYYLPAEGALPSRLCGLVFGFTIRRGRR